MVAGFVKWTSSLEEANWGCFAEATRQLANGTGLVPGDQGQHVVTTTPTPNEILLKIPLLQHL